MPVRFSNEFKKTESKALVSNSNAPTAPNSVSPPARQPTLKRKVTISVKPQTTDVDAVVGWSKLDSPKQESLQRTVTFAPKVKNKLQSTSDFEDHKQAKVEADAQKKADTEAEAVTE